MKKIRKTMSWQPIDFQGITSIDTSLVDLIHQYLEEKEGDLSKSILEAIPEELIPALPYSFNTPIKLSDAIEMFNKKCLQITMGTITNEGLNWKRTVHEINQALWEYVEVLEGCATELYQQLEQIGLEQWHPRLPHVVSTINELLLHKMEDLTWGIKRLEGNLWKYRISCEKQLNRSTLLLNLSHYWKSLLDRDLTGNLDKCQAFLRSQSYKFLKRYGGYVELQEKVDKYLEKLETYPVLSSLERSSQIQFKKLYQLLKLWELNRQEKAVPSRELVLAIRHALSIEKAIGLIKEYYDAFKAHLFRQSRSLKNLGERLLTDDSLKNNFKENITQCLEEIHMMGATSAGYRDFLLRADPDPYVRSRLGFSEWITGPEPAQTKPLLDLGYEMESLNTLCERLGDALDRDPEISASAIDQVDPTIKRALHEMNQPLVTHRMMRNKAEVVLDGLQKLNEWEAFSQDVVHYVGQVFLALLRRDWKFQVVHELNLFHQLYQIHQGLLKPIDDRAHTARLQKFTKLLHQIQDWVSKNRAQSHFHDIEMDLNDIKEYLQDFLGYVQRVFQDKHLTFEKAQEWKAKIDQELLEYRFLFGSFFYHLRQNEVEGQLIRRQCLFVDQYFETVEQLLYEVENRTFESPEEPKKDDDDD